MEILSEMLRGTPWWVFLIFGILVKIGLDATKSHRAPIGKLVIMPGGFFILSLVQLLKSPHFSAELLASFILALLVGAYGGFRLVQNKDIRFDAKKGLVYLPASWVTLTLVLTIFSAKYYFGYQLAAHPELEKDTHFAMQSLGTSGVCSGLFIGRFICYITRHKVIRAA
ncbi:MAG: hypothetical protein KDK62_07925 [Chlamydiia bacterium]|nr:hypothetical protein [Chlamydiia bacterium]